MKSTNGNKIINVLLAVCIATAFASFALIILPNQLKKAVAVPISGKELSPPANLSSIVSLDKINRIEIIKNPEIPPAASHESDDKNDPDDTIIAGGAGAAIDSDSSESRDALLAYNKTSSISMNKPASKHETQKDWTRVPPELEADVMFWHNIYAKYDRNQVVLHHPRHLDIVYDVVDLTDIEKNPRLTDIEKEHLREKRVEQKRDEVTDALRKLAARPASSSLSNEEVRIKKLFQNLNETNAFKRAADEDGVRAQLGQKDKFLIGLKYSGRYLGEIEAIFDSYGMPRELTRLIFVESMFNPYARSSVGASGIWQFMRGTGKLFLKINDIVDERNDPIAATHAAAKLLRHDYEILGAWPLAINAYNTGRGRMQQAVTELGTTDIAKIVRNFHCPSYAFASRNFFLEFLAALDVVEHAEKYFGPIEYDKPLSYELIKADYNISLPEVANAANINLDEILDLNPAFTPKVVGGNRLVPSGFTIRVPAKTSNAFLAATVRAPRSRTGNMKHVVQDGETLLSISDMYDIPSQKILDANKRTSRRLQTGQVIVIPVGK